MAEATAGDMSCHVILACFLTSLPPPIPLVYIGMQICYDARSFDGEPEAAVERLKMDSSNGKMVRRG